VDTKLFVGNLPYDFSEDRLGESCSLAVVAAAVGLNKNEMRVELRGMILSRCLPKTKRRKTSK
jgi:hypothetical protein